MELILLWLTFILLLIMVATATYVGYNHIKMRRAQKTLEAVMKASDGFVMLWSTDMKSFAINDSLRAFLTSIGHSADKQLVFDIFNREGTPNSYKPTDLITAAFGSDVYESTFTAANGDVSYITWKSETIFTNGRNCTVASVGTDVTDKTLMKNELEYQRIETELSRENLDIAMESAEIGIISITLDNFDFHVELSENGLKMLGYEKDDIITLDDINKRVYGVDYNDYMAQLGQLLSGNGDALNLEVKLRIDENIYHSFMLKFKAIKDEYGNILRITGAFIDITTQRENYSLYDRSANEDALTGIANRRGFMAQGTAFLQRCKQSGRKAVIIAIKLLKLTKINTLFGLETGDAMLKLYAESLAKYTEGKALIGRIGTDDFAVLSEYEDTAEIERFTKGLSIMIESGCNNERLPSVLKEQCHFIAGICYYDTYDDIMTLYNKANITLYTGSNINATVCHYFDETIEQKVCERELIEQEISDAIKHNEFELYYQPKISFKTGAILGAEALIRWHHPKKGLIFPDEFIPIAEESGLITKIDEWGLHEACIQNKFWQNKGFKPIRVSVNASQAQLFQTDIVESIKRSLEESDLQPQYLEIELTETMAMQDIDYTIAVLKRIRELGVFVSMDDFGTGYSSLSSLKVLPIDILKIDKNLIYDIGENDTARHITKAIVELGKAMNLQVLAEGVETEQQCELLEKIGCDVAQGFFYGRPVTVAELERMFLMPQKAETAGE